MYSAFEFEPFACLSVYPEPVPVRLPLAGLSSLAVGGRPDVAVVSRGAAAIAAAADTLSDLPSPSAATGTDATIMLVATATVIGEFATTASATPLYDHSVSRAVARLSSDSRWPNQCRAEDAHPTEGKTKA